MMKPLDLKQFWGSQPVALEQLGGGLDKLSFSVKQGSKFYVMQLLRHPLLGVYLDRQERLADYLCQHQFQTRRLARDSRGEKGLWVLTQSQFKNLLLLVGVSGKSIIWSHYTARRVISALRYLGRLHVTLRCWQGRDAFPFQTETLEAERRELEKHANQLGLEMMKIQPLFSRLTDLAGRRDSSTLLHGDYGRGNLIFEGENIAGAVDWDQACWGHPLFDVARFASYLLIDTPLSLRTVGELVTSAYPGWNKLKVDLPDLKKGIEYCWLTDLIRWAQQRHTPNFQKLQMCLIRQGYLNYGKN